MFTTCKRLLKAAAYIMLMSLVSLNPATAAADAHTPADATDEAVSRAAAREAYDAGQAAYKKKEYATALVHFQKAYDIKPHISVLGSIAECKLQLGQTPDAVILMEQLIADPDYQGKAKMKTRLRAAQKEVGHLTIESIPPSATVTLNEKALSDPAPVSIYVMPGTQVISLAMTGYADQSVEVTVAKGKKETVSVDFSVLEPLPVEEKRPQLIDPFEEDMMMDAPAEEPALDEDDLFRDDDHQILETTASAGPPNAFWVAAAIAGVGVVSGTVFGTMALRDEKDFNKNGDDAVKQSGERSALIADVSFGVAIGAAIVGTVILIANKTRTDQTQATARTRRLTWAPVLGSDTAGINTALSF